MSIDPQLGGEISLRAPRKATTLWWCAALLIGLGVLATPVDTRIAAWARAEPFPSIVYKVCSLSEVMGHGAGVLMVVAVVAALDPRRRRQIPRILAAALGSGLLANAFKLVLARTRPNHFDLNLQAADSFGSWFPLLDNPSWNQGFPSSHTATAAGLAIALCWLYPRGRVLFPSLAALAGLQRVLEEAHFTSDVLWGAAVGCLFAPFCMDRGILSRTFDRLEGTVPPSSRAPQESRSLQQADPPGAVPEHPSRAA